MKNLTNSIRTWLSKKATALAASALHQSASEEEEKRAETEWRLALHDLQQHIDEHRRSARQSSSQIIAR